MAVVARDESGFLCWRFTLALAPVAYNDDGCLASPIGVA
jgi:hypothetical protein